MINKIYNHFIVFNIFLFSFLYSNIIPSGGLLDKPTLRFVNSTDKFVIPSQTSVKVIDDAQVEEYKKEYELIEIHKIIDSESGKELQDVMLVLDYCVYNSNNEIFISKHLYDIEKFDKTCKKG